MKIMNKIALLAISGFLIGSPVYGMSSSSTGLASTSNDNADDLSGLVHTDEIGNVYSDLYLAIIQGDLDRAKELVEIGADTTCVWRGESGNRYSAIWAAVAYQQKKITKYLVEDRKVDIARGKENCEEETVLAAALYVGDKESVKYFVEQRNANTGIVQSRNGKNKSALSVATELSRGSREHNHIREYLQAVDEYQSRNRINTSWSSDWANNYHKGNWLCNYFCLAAHAQNISDMRRFFKDQQNILTLEDKRSLIIGLHDGAKYTAMRELFVLFNVEERDFTTGFLVDLPIDKKYINEYFAYRNRLKMNTFQDVLFVITDN